MSPAPFFAISFVLAAPWLVPPASAEVVDSSAAGFSVTSSADIAAPPMAVWDVLRSPARWWSSEHSWSGDADNFWLDAQAGGCFCESLPGDATRRGSVRHAEVVFAKPGEALRLSGAFGPLQSEALTATLSIAIVPVDGGSQVRFDYVVGGYSRTGLGELAPAVDSVIALQLRGLKTAIEGAAGASANE